MQKISCSKSAAVQRVSDARSQECAKCHRRPVGFRDSGGPNDMSVVVWCEWTTTVQQYEKDGAQKTTKITSKSPKRGMLRDLKTLFSNTVKTYWHLM